MIRHSHCPPHQANPRLVGNSPLRWGEDEDLVPAILEVIRQLSDVDLDPAGCVPGIGTCQDDLHLAAEPSDPSGPPFSSQAGWNMCQSTGAEAM